MRNPPAIRLTYGRLALLVTAIWTVVFTVGLVLPHAHARVTDEPPSLAAAEDLYQRYAIGAAEEMLVEYIRANPDDRDACELIVHYRVVYDDPTQYFLNADQFRGLLDRCPATEQMEIIFAVGRNPELAARDMDASTAVALGCIREFQGESEAALKLYREGLALVDQNESGDQSNSEYDDATADRARLGILDSLIDLGWYREYVETMRVSEFLASADEFHIYMNHLKNGRYLEMIPPLVSHESGQYETRWVLAGLGAGCCWLLFVLHLSRAGQWPARTFALAFAALVLGALSAYGTIVALLITEEYLPFSRLEPTLINELIHMILGVGLREELIKLVCFLPLAPFLLRANDRTVLTVAALVGLGFAIEENILYYADYGGTAIVARFLTANFLHMSLTGFVAYYFILALRNGGEAWSDFAAQFGLVVLIHGVYDFLLGERFQRGELLAMVVHIWLAYQFLLLFARLDQGGARRLPITYVFVGAMALLAGIGYLMLVPEMGPAEAARQTVLQLVGVAMITLVFFISFREPVG